MQKEIHEYKKKHVSFYETLGGGNNALFKSISQSKIQSKR